MKLERVTLTDPGSRSWAVQGAGGVAAWSYRKEADDLPGEDPITLHSPRRLRDHVSISHEECPYLHGVCWVDLIRDSGGLLGIAWDEADEDDNVIWRWLEAFYREFLGEAAETGRK